MYSIFDLRYVSKNISKLTKLPISINEDPENGLEIYVVKTVSKSLTNEANISVKDMTDDITHGKRYRVGDKIMIPYDRPDKESLLQQIHAELTNLESKRLELCKNDERVKGLYALGIVKGSLLKCTVTRLLPLGAILLSCNRIPDVTVMLNKDKTINEVYEVGKELYVIVDRFQTIGNSLTVLVSRRSKNLVKELLYESVAASTNNSSELIFISRIVDEASYVFINGPYGNYIGKSGENLNAVRSKVNNERIRFLRWDPRLPVRVLNTLPETSNIYDIYYPQETGKSQWTVVINTNDFKKVLSRDAEALKFVKLMNNKSIYLESENYLSTEHAPYQYDGHLLENEDDIIRRFYYYEFNAKGIYSDEDFYNYHSKLTLPESDMDYLINEWSSIYSVQCPVCNANIKMTDKECPECGSKLGE